MDIVVLDPPEGDVVGREMQFGEVEGKFLLQDDGSVVYRSPYDEKMWLAGPSVEAFRGAAASWRRYNEDVTAANTEEAQLAVAARLRRELEHLGVLTDPDNSVWAIFAEQAQDGQL